MIFSCFPWIAIFVVEGNWISMWTKFLINHQTGRAEDKSHQLAVHSSPYMHTEPSLNPGLEFGHLHNFKFTFTIFLPNLHFLRIVTKIIFLGFKIEEATIIQWQQLPKVDKVGKQSLPASARSAALPAFWLWPSEDDTGLLTSQLLENTCVCLKVPSLC